MAKSRLQLRGGREGVLPRPSGDEEFPLQQEGAPQAVGALEYRDTQGLETRDIRSSEGKEEGCQEVPPFTGTRKDPQETIIGGSSNN